MDQQLNSKDPLVSVITPFLNGSDWLREAVQSVIDQSYTNWELILIDDGSKEEASGVAKSFSEQHPGKIIYTQHPNHQNKGVAASRNLGVNTSKGYLIAFLDSDDRWMPHKLERQVSLFLHHPQMDMLCEASLYWCDWENPSAQNRVVKVGAGANRLYEPPELMNILYPLRKGAAPCPSGIMVTKKSLVDTGGFEESFVGSNQVYEDQAFLCKYYLTQKVYITDEVNNYYRQRTGSLMESISQKKKYKTVRKYFFGWLDKYLADHSFGNRKIERLLRMAKFQLEYPRLYKVIKKLRSIF